VRSRQAQTRWRGDPRNPSSRRTYNHAVARIRDWIELGKTTVSSLTQNDVTNLYSYEWPETRRMLTAEHDQHIENSSGLKRIIRTASAVMYGLTKRLAPSRRVVFLAAFILFGFTFAAILSGTKNVDNATVVVHGLSFTAIVFLLALELIDKIKYRDELVLARDLQASLVPAHPPQPPGFEIAAFNVIANTVGGDIYDFVELPDGRTAILFGDASGHGMAAGLVMAVAHAAFRTQLEIDPSPQSIVSSLNRILCRTGTNRSFFASCYALLEPNGHFVATVAGHPQILLADQSGVVRDHVGRGSYPLGIKAGLDWEVLEGQLQPGEMLVFHSDGLTETRNPNQVELGDAFLEAMLTWSPSARASQIVDTIVSEWRTFSGGLPAEDDVSIAVIKRL
jgi:serine phosphatase RsbU (regulator of sigma subunit)